MNTVINAQELFAASQIHLNVLEEFIGTVEARLAAPLPAFTRESLIELLAGLREQRASYRVLVQSEALAA